MGKNQDPIVATTVPSEWLVKLQKLAEADGKTQTEVVYDAIAAYLNPKESNFAALQNQVNTLEQKLTVLTTNHEQLVQSVQKLDSKLSDAASKPTPSSPASTSKQGSVTSPQAKGRGSKSKSSGASKSSSAKIPKKELVKLQKGIPAVALGRRLGVSSQAIANARKKGPEHFAQWSLSSNKQGKKADPDGLTWEWRDKGSTMKYYPILDPSVGAS